MRKGSKRKARPAAIPTLVFLHTIPDAEIAQLTALAAFQGGYASPGQFDILLDTRDLLFLSAHDRGDEGVMMVCRAANEVLGAVRESWDGERFAALDDDSINTLSAMVDVSIDWWRRKSGVSYQRAYMGLKQWREHQQHQKESGRIFEDESRSQETRADEAGLVCGGVV